MLCSCIAQASPLSRQEDWEENELNQANPPNAGNAKDYIEKIKAALNFMRNQCFEVDHLPPTKLSF